MKEHGKTRLWMMVLCLFAGGVGGAQTTTNLNLNTPIPGTPNWGTAVNTNFTILDTWSASPVFATSATARTFMAAQYFTKTGSPLTADIACTAGVFWIAPILGSTNAWRMCNNGALTSIAGGGSVSGQASNVIPLGTGITSIGAQSHLSDSGGVITSTEPVVLPSATISGLLNAKVVSTNGSGALQAQTTTGTGNTVALSDSPTFTGSLTAATATVGTLAYAPISTRYLVTEGDSVTAGAFLNNPGTESWPAQVMNLAFFKNRATLVNAAVSGSTCASMTARYAGSVLPFRPNGTTITTSYLTVLIGRNDLSGLAATLENCINAYVTQAKADGFTVIIMSILPSTMITTPYGGFVGAWDSIFYPADAVRRTVNNYLRQNSLIDYSTVYFFDFAQLLVNPYDSTWTYDGTHPTAAADASFARSVNTFFQNISATQNSKPIESGAFDVLQGGNGAGGVLWGAGNLGATPGYPGPGIMLGWNASNGNQEADFIAVPSSGTSNGFSWYYAPASADSITAMGTWTPLGLTVNTAITTPTVAVTGSIGGASGQAVAILPNGAPTFDFTVRNAANNANNLLVSDTGDVGARGNMDAASFSAGGTAGFTGTKTAGSCVLTIKNGIITNVTGC